MAEKIVMGGEYVLRGTREPVRILCVDRPGQFPVVALGGTGIIHTRLPDGRRDPEAFASPMDLVPAKPPLQPITPGVYRTRDGSERRVVMVDYPGPQPILAVEDNFNPTRRYADGRLLSDCDGCADLVERIGDLP